MAASILTDSAAWEQVRKALDASLTVDDLPDATIGLPFYLEVGEAMMLAQVPGGLGLTGVDAVFFKAATVAQVAALLAPAMTGILPKSEEGLTYKVTRDPVEWDKREKQLQTLAVANLGRLSTAAAPVPFSQITLAGPTRKAKAANTP